MPGSSEENRTESPSHSPSHPPRVCSAPRRLRPANFSSPQSCPTRRRARPPVEFPVMCRRRRPISVRSPHAPDSNWEAACRGYQRWLRYRGGWEPAMEHRLVGPGPYRATKLVSVCVGAWAEPPAPRSSGTACGPPARARVWRRRCVGCGCCFLLVAQRRAKGA